MNVTYVELYSTILLSFFTLFATISPINGLIVFLKLTNECTPEERKEIKNKSVLVASIILIVLTLIGPSGFKLLGIDLYSVKIAGGIILGVVSIGMVFGINKEVSNDQLKKAKHITIVPLALPIITGPAAIVSSLVLFADETQIILKLVVLAMVIFNLFLVYLLFTMSDILVKYIKKSVLNILYILSGIILTALAAQFIITGAKESGIFKKLSYNSNEGITNQKEVNNATRSR
ncbi:MarC family protein [Rickettsiales bacterium LUAb2]